MLIYTLNSKDVLKVNTVYLPVWFFTTNQAKLAHTQKSQQAEIFYIQTEILVQQYPWEKGRFSAWPKAGEAFKHLIADGMLIPLGALPLCEAK